MRSNNKIIIQTSRQTADIRDLFGIFFEDINHAADGGLYAELVQNRSFEFASIDNPSYHGMTGWEILGDKEDIKCSVMEGDAVSTANPHYLHIEVSGADRKANGMTGVRNVGFGDGMFFEEGKRYLFSCYARCGETKSGIVTVSMMGAQKEVLVQQTFTVTGQWKQQKLIFEAPTTEQKGSLALTVSKAAEIDLDFVSLFPEDTFFHRENGLRRDLAEALRDLKPRFMRFPGGCLVHDGSLDENARDSMYRWKKTVGSLIDRPARRSNWNYNQTLGLGYYEYFLFCEDIKAKPVPILPAAYNPHRQQMVPLDQLQPWIEDALDLIEFANGDVTTKWGALRSLLGHAEPFHLEYIGIGNEEVGEGFTERFPCFVEAIRKKYPEIKIIGSSGPFCAGSEYERGWHCARKTNADIVDEHYYMAPEWFLANMHRYDKFDLNGPKVFLGEYAARSNKSDSALTEAAYMVQLQNAAGRVQMACYAPLLCHKAYENWKPDLIWFSNDRICKTVNYEVQKLFMNHQGDVLVPCRLETQQAAERVVDQQARTRGGICLMGNHASVRFTSIVIENEDTGEIIKHPDIVQEAEEKTSPLIPFSDKETEGKHYTIQFQAQELEGERGFLIYFAWKDEKNRLCWELGGWQNQDSFLVEEIGGRRIDHTQCAFSVEKNRIYNLKIHVAGEKVEFFIDGELLQKATLSPVEKEPLYVTASREEDTGDIILKAVNLREETFESAVCLPDLEEGIYQCERFELEEKCCQPSPDFEDVETAVVTSKTESVKMPGKSGEKKMEVQFPSRSVSVFRIHKKCL